MKMQLSGIVIALACCGASAAKADWEYVKWGMTPQQVVNASNNLAKENSDDLRPDSDGNVTKLVAPYRSGRLSFEAQFGFDAANTLASVTLVLKDKSAGMDMDADMDAAINMNSSTPLNMDEDVCRDLHVRVKTAYGPPQGGGTADMLYSIETWQDQKNKNNVRYTVLDGTGCYVQYSIIKPAKPH